MTPPAVTLPIPQVVARTYTPPPVVPIPILTPSLSPSVPELAHQVYGDRLIEWVEIPAINLLAPVTPVGWQADVDPGTVEWESPGAMVGWAISSALPGDSGNIILYGHNNIESSIFQNLFKVKTGNEIILTTPEYKWQYRVDLVRILAVSEESEDAVIYATYLNQSHAPRLTLISCYPPDNNTHRVIVIAYPKSY